MTDDMPRPPTRNRPRRELMLILLLGVAGSGLVFLAMRQGWAQVHTVAPRPFPSGVVTETGQDLVPAADALAVAALASLAAVLATRGIARRAAGVVLAGFGAGIIVAVGSGVSAAHVIAAAQHGPQADSGAGNVAGSATAGSVTGGGAPAPVTGLAAHVRFAAFPWHAVALLGAAAVIAAGALVVWRAGHLPVMSSRYDAPSATAPVPAPALAATGTTGATGPAAGTALPAGSPRPGDPGTPVGASQGAAGRQAAGPGSETAPRGDTATIWESLSRGEDPT